MKSGAPVAGTVLADATTGAKQSTYIDESAFVVKKSTVKQHSKPIEITGT